MASSFHPVQRPLKTVNAEKATAIAETNKSFHGLYLFCFIIFLFSFNNFHLIIFTFEEFLLPSVENGRKGYVAKMLINSQKNKTLFKSQDRRANRFIFFYKSELTPIAEQDERRPVIRMREDFFGVFFEQRCFVVVQVNHVRARLIHAFAAFRHDDDLRFVR